MASKFKKLILDGTEKADETWVNPDHIVAITPDPRQRFMTVVLDVPDLSGLSWGPKVYRTTIESARELLET